ncbi:MAG: hypothetical protein ACRD2P_18555, partial [Terriglobia bacterium]
IINMSRLLFFDGLAFTATTNLTPEFRSRRPYVIRVLWLKLCGFPVVRVKMPQSFKTKTLRYKSLSHHVEIFETNEINETVFSRPVWFSGQDGKGSLT